MIKVLFFAQLKDQIGSESITLEEQKLTVKELVDKLTEEHKMQNLDTVMIAINEEYATENDEIKSGDTVALIPPVSGG